MVSSPGKTDNLLMAHSSVCSASLSSSESPFGAIEVYDAFLEFTYLLDLRSGGGRRSLSPAECEWKMW